MTDRELDERIARAMGWTYAHDVNVTGSGWIRDAWDTGRGYVELSDFSPATSVDALRKWVLPEISERELWDEFEEQALLLSGGYSGALLLQAEPYTLAAAALAVMEEDNA